MKDDSIKGPKYFVNIEGKEYPWERDTITREEIAQLGGWEISQGVIEIDKDNVERTLNPGEQIELKPGHGFSKKIIWKRGDNAVQSRIQEELALLRAHFSQVDYEEQGQWVKIHDYPLPIGWNRSVTDIVSQIPPAYPGAHPYGFYVPTGIRFQDCEPKNYKDTADNKPPFEGSWGFFSWSPEDPWRPTTDLVSGSNLLNVVRTFADRLREGI
jgi:hypothetical protein